MAPHSSTFAWKIPWMEEPGGLQSMGSLQSDPTERLHFHFSLSSRGFLFQSAVYILLPGDGHHKGIYLHSNSKYFGTPTSTV